MVRTRSGPGLHLKLGGTTTSRAPIGWERGTAAALARQPVRTLATGTTCGRSDRRLSASLAGLGPHDTVGVTTRWVDRAPRAAARRGVDVRLKRGATQTTRA